MAPPLLDSVNFTLVSVDTMDYLNLLFCSLVIGLRESSELHQRLSQWSYSEFEN